jgi:hypothetical protein
MHRAPFCVFFITNTFNHRLPAFVVFLGAATLVAIGLALSGLL